MPLLRVTLSVEPSMEMVQGMLGQENRKMALKKEKKNKLRWKRSYPSM